MELLRYNPNGNATWPPIAVLKIAFCTWVQVHLQCIFTQIGVSAVHSIIQPTAMWAKNRQPSLNMQTTITYVPTRAISIQMAKPSVISSGNHLMWITAHLSWAAVLDFMVFHTELRSELGNTHQRRTWARQVWQRKLCLSPLLPVHLG